MLIELGQRSSFLEENCFKNRFNKITVSGNLFLKFEISNLVIVCAAVKLSAFVIRGLFRWNGDAGNTRAKYFRYFSLILCSTITTFVNNEVVES